MNTEVQDSTELFEAPAPITRTACRRTLFSRPKASVSIRTRPLAQQEESRVIEIAEGMSQYSIVVPLAGIDPRSVYVFATPRSLLIEFRAKRVVSHKMINGFVTESIKQRISREFSLPVEIEQDTTIVKVCGDSLQITAGKSQEEQQKPWSQFIHFDTRASLGCI